MIKEKVRVSDVSLKNKEFYYEILGISFILLCLIIFSELGSFGLGLKILLKLLFGDWYLLNVTLLLLLGIKFIIKHKGLNIKSLSFQGFLLLSLCLMLLSHISVHKFLSNQALNPISGLFQLYRAYIANYSNDYAFGGGAIGGLIYEGINYILGDIGLILICIILLLFSVIFLTNNSLASFYKKVRFDRLKFSKSFIKIKTYFKNIDVSKVKKFKPNKINISNLSDYESSFNYNLQIKKSEEIKMLINNVFSTFKTEYKEVSFDVGYLYTKYKYQIIHNFIFDKFKDKLTKVLEIPLYITYKNSILTIEMNNKFKELVTLKKLWLDKNFSNIPLGLSAEMEICPFSYEENKSMLLISNNYKDTELFIKSFLVSNFLTNKEIKFNIFDGYNNFSSLKFIQNTEYYETNLQYFIPDLEKLSDTLDKRMEIFNMLKVNSFEEVNRTILKNEELKSIPRIILFINGLEIIEKSSYRDNLFNKLIYFAQVGEKYGIHLLTVMTDNFNLPASLKSLLPTKIIFKLNSYIDSISFLDDDHAIYINQNEFIYKFQDKLKRLQIPYILDTDYDEIIKKL